MKILLMDEGVYVMSDTTECGCGRMYVVGQSHCYCDYEYVVEGIVPTIKVADPDSMRFITKDSAGDLE